jgi:hypothetical protein
MDRKEEQEWKRRGAAIEQGRIEEQQRQDAYKALTKVGVNCGVGCGCLFIILGVLVVVAAALR